MFILANARVKDQILLWLIRTFISQAKTRGNKEDMKLSYPFVSSEHKFKSIDYLCMYLSTDHHGELPLIEPSVQEQHGVYICSVCQAECYSSTV